MEKVVDSVKKDTWNLNAHFKLFRTALIYDNMYKLGIAIMNFCEFKIKHSRLDINMISCCWKFKQFFFINGIYVRSKEYTVAACAEVKVC